MKIEMMRHIDYFVGRPICFLLSIVNSFLNLFNFARKPNTDYKKILFIKLSEMGSIILAHSLIDKARKDYPQAKIIFVTFEKNRYIFDLIKLIPDENVLTIRESPFHLFLWDSLKVIARLGREKIDIAFDLELFSRCTAILTYLSGAKKRAGFYRYDFEGLYRGNLLTHKVQYNPLIHTSISFLSLWQVIKTPYKSTPELYAKIKDDEIYTPNVEIDRQAKEDIKSRLAKFGINSNSRIFLINPGEGRLPLREWPFENYVVIAKKILENENNCLLIVGTEDFSNKINSLVDKLNNPRCINLVNKTTLQELLALYDMAEVLIANDCGLAHLASLTKVKKFIFFGPETPQLYLPLGGGETSVFYSGLPCSPCFSALNHRKSSCKDNICLKTISPQEVIAKMEKVIS